MACIVSYMAEDKPRLRGHDMGATGEAVARNLKFLRGGVSLRELQQKLRDVGHEISASGLQKIEAGVRRVDVDDLMALAIALGVNPNSLLLPWSSEEPLEVTGAMPLNLISIWDWAEGVAPIDDNHKQHDLDFQRRIRPAGVGWMREVASDPLANDFRTRLDEIGENIKALMEQAGIEERAADGDS